jgi:hypothetical protein
MVVNFIAHGISRRARKLGRTPMLIIIKKEISKRENIELEREGEEK